MKTKRTAPDQDRVTISVQMSRATLEQFRQLAVREHRPVTAQIRWLMQEYIDSQTSLKEAA